MRASEVTRFLMLVCFTTTTHTQSVIALCFLRESYTILTHGEFHLNENISGKQAFHWCKVKIPSDWAFLTDFFQCMHDCQHKVCFVFIFFLKTFLSSQKMIDLIWTQVLYDYYAIVMLWQIDNIQHLKVLDKLKPFHAHFTAQSEKANEYLNQNKLFWPMRSKF